jgi:hypothetical protein
MLLPLCVGVLALSRACSAEPGGALGGVLENSVNSGRLPWLSSVAASAPGSSDSMELA